MNRLTPSSLQVQQLEDRATPAIFGQPWLDGHHLTLSFAPDGALISGVANDLSGLLNPLGSNDAKLELLRAFQTWTQFANLNIGLTADSNWAFGTAGAVQGDPRFGDIRIGSRSMAGDVVAITAPFSLLTPNSGDMIFNSAKSFAFGNADSHYDLFTIALQESGHAFGLGNSIDTASAMFEQYGLARTGLSLGDITGIQALYGVRSADAFEGALGNGITTTATTYSGALEADLTTAADVDVYRYTASSTDGKWFKIKAAGLSLVSAKLEVLDSTGQVIGSAQASSPLQNDVSVYVPGLVPGDVYYMRVSAARSDAFGIGSYRLAVDASSGSAASDPYALVDNETSANNTIGTATAATPSTGPYSYSLRSTLKSSSDIDYFKIHSPALTNSNLIVTVSAVGASWFTPDVDIYTAAGTQLSTKIIAQTDSSLVLSLEGASANTDYFVRVASTFRQAGNYDFVADFRAASLPTMMGAHGTLDSTNRATSATLTIYQSQTIQVNQLATLQSGADMVSLVRIYDSQNRIVFELYSITELLSTGQVFLNRGVYRIEVQSLTSASINFSLTLFGVTDPTGSSPTDPTGDPAGDPNNPPPPPPPDDTTTVTVTPPPAPPPTVTWF